MQWLGEPPAGAVSEPTLMVLERALERGAPQPGALVFLDPNQRWRDALCRLSLAERRACLAVALDDHDLEPAVRWSIGGGVLLPVSVTRVVAACHAAAQASVLPSWIADPAVVAEIKTSVDALSLSLQPEGVWEVLAGRRGCFEALTALATSLGQPALLDSGPRLTVIGSTPSEVESAWEHLEGRPLWACDTISLSIRGVELEAGTGLGKPESREQGWPVAQWPSGKPVARWRLQVDDSECPWRLETPDGKELSSEMVTTRQEVLKATAPVLRVGGSLPCDLDREGSPGTTVIEALAREADRSGRILWIPGVTQRAATVIRHWGVTVWIDGPVLGQDYST